jgi:hypothetical protein
VGCYWSLAGRIHRIQFGRRCNEAGRIDIVVNDRLGLVDMPPTIRDQYQYFTQATFQNLRRADRNAGFKSPSRHS